MKKLESRAGNHIETAIRGAIAEAVAVHDTVEFEFNGVTVQVAADSDPALVLRDWWRGLLRPSGNAVSACRIERRAIKTATLTEALAAVPPLAFKDEARWKEYVAANSDGGYGEACVRYAEKWGRLMQSRMLPLINLDLSPDMISVNVTKFLVKEADKCSHVADDEGITGFMYGAAVSMLSQCWIYGEELRRWHNLKTQLRDEGEKANESGGVLNPAVLTIG